MADIPTSSKWKAFLKGKAKAEEGNLSKVLDRYHKTDSDDPAALAEALEGLIEEAEAVKKKNSKNKEVVGYLGDLIDDAEKALDKASEEALEQSKEEGDDDEAEAGAALRTMLLRAKKIIDADKALPFVLALGAAAGLVLAERPPLSKAHKDTARAMRTGKGKLLFGRCYGDKGKYVFEFEDGPPGGLTKVIKKAAKVHAGLEIRLLVRGGGVEFDDETDVAELTDFGDEAPETDANGADAGGDANGAVNELVEKYRPRIASVLAGWEQVRAGASQGADDLSRRLRATGDLDATRAAEVVDGLAGEFPDGLDAALDNIQDAVNRNDGKALGTLVDAADDHVKECLLYLKVNKELIGYCENNSFGARVSIRQPLVKALQSVLAGLK